MPDTRYPAGEPLKITRPRATRSATAGREAAAASDLSKVLTAFWPTPAQIEERRRLAQQYLDATAPKSKKAKPLSTPQRWAAAAERAVEALEELEEMRSEYEEKRDNLPENLSGSAYGEKLNEVADLDIDSAKQIAEEARDVELPLGFGRD